MLGDMLGDLLDAVLRLGDTLVLGDMLGVAL